MTSSSFSTMTADALPFDKPGQFYRGNIHGHSTRSDGHWNPDEYIANYRNAGYDFVAITDHFLKRFDYPLVDTRKYRTDDFTTLLGAELHHGNIKFGTKWHLLSVGLPLDFAPYTDDETPADVVQRALDAGAFVAVPHPNWYTLTVEDFESLGGVHAVEIYNGTAERHNDRANGGHFIDTLTALGHRIGILAVDDLHMTEGKDDFARGWVHVKAENLTPDSLLEALKVGHYYSSTGPQIHNIEVIGREKIIVECSPAQAILVVGDGPWTVREDGHGLMSAELDISAWDSPKYCTVTVIDRNGGRAWSNPIWLE
jgi:hypothetical protein